MTSLSLRADIHRLATESAYRAEYRAVSDAAHKARVAEIDAARREERTMIAKLATAMIDDPETEFEFALAVERFAGADTFEQWIDAVRPEEDTNAAEIAESHAIEARILRNAQ